MCTINRYVNQCYNCPQTLDFPANPCHTIGMKTNNPYVNTLLEMGYDIKDTQTIATKKTFPCIIHGRQFDTEEQYNDELNEYMMGL